MRDYGSHRLFFEDASYRSICCWAHRRRRLDSTVELSRVSGVNAPVAAVVRDPVYNNVLLSY